jgi:hypothetical protein
MSQTAITLAFERWKAQQGANSKPVILDEFVLANVPDLDPTADIDRNETQPPAGQIVHRQAVGMTGVVNENAVVYSVTLGSDVGDFSFNWIGLTNKATGTLAMVIHAPLQTKYKNASGQQGNVLTRSFLMEYNGAATETQITTPAETWQIDFTARLAGIDERQRLDNIDIYGQGAFLGDGFLVAKTGNQYFVTQGVGYIGGLRASLAANSNITVTTKPIKVWADVSYHGTLTSAFQTDIKLTLATALDNYTQAGIAHYVFALASIDANGVITDLRPKGSLGEQQGSRDYLRKDKNLSDVNDVPSARKSLGLKGAAVLDVGATAGTVAAGDDSRIVNALQKGNNLSEIVNKEQARSNLELKSAALRDVQASRDDATPGRVLINGGTFVVGASQVGLHVGNADFQFGGGGIFTAPDSIKAVGGATELAANAIYVRGTGNKHLWFYSSTGIERGLIYASDDNVIHMRSNSGPSLDVNAMGEVTVNGPQVKAPYFRAVSNPGAGGFVYQLDLGAAFYRNEGSQRNEDNTYFPLCKGRVVLDGGFPVAYSFGYVTAGWAAFGSLCIQAKTDAPDKDRLWMFSVDSGNFVCPGDVVTNNLRASTAVFAGNATYGSDGNIHGAIWGGYLSTWLNGQLSVRDTAIGNVDYAVRNWANTDLRNDIYNWVRAYFIQSIRFGASGEYQERSNNERVGGGVMTSFADRGSSNYWVRIRPLQYLINGTWVTAAYS